MNSSSRIRKTLSCCFLAAVSAATAAAQNTYDLAEYSQVKSAAACVPSYSCSTDTATTDYYPTNAGGYRPAALGEHWFAYAGAGISSFIGSPTGCNDFFGREKFAVSVSLGKWLTPYLGLRATFDGFRFRDAQNEDYGYHALRGDILWNVSAYTRPDMTVMPRWDVIPFLGFGVVHNGHYSGSPFAVTPGIEFRHRITDRLYFGGRLSCSFTKTRFDGYGKSSGMNDKMLTATIGLSYTFGGNKWHRRHGGYAPSVYSGYDIRLPYSITRNDYSGLNSLRRRLGEGDGEAGQTVTDSVASHVIGVYFLFFRKGTARFTDSNQKMNVKYVSHLLRRHPDYKVIINGAADSRTGSSSTNRKLAIKRAKAIRSMMAGYGVDESRLKVTSRGGIDRYSPVSANRQTYIRVYRTE